ncbi:Acetyl-CoA:oxalate CoA-transferase [compost metagenome]
MTDNQPLKGIRVLDFTQLLPGPLCTLHLADLGAEVIKIEPPRVGDPTRGPKQFTPMFLMLNRNKRSLEVDLRSAEGVELLQALAKTADVVVEGFRPGVAERLGVGYRQLSELNPRLVYCSISGYGQQGPLAQAAGHDINYQSLAGVLDQTGSAGGAPVQGNLPVADVAGGALSAATGILAALFDAARSGKGRHVDIAMTDCVMALNIMTATSWQSAGQVLPRGQDFLSGGLACYGCYRTADRRYLAVGAVEHKFWVAFCDAVGLPHLHDKGHAFGEAGATAKAAVAEAILQHDLAHWTRVFSEVDACVTPVLRLDEVVEHANTQARGMVRQDRHPQAGGYMSFACPLRMGEGDWPEPTPAPLLGADNLSIRQELGLA